ncbi:uncharacterized protein LOC100367746 [Saccoglossus kowalevskii]|uniref:Uncharacterized protein LOC100367746 n=1 Tax=Saccoglossus kowalevskii TaxID=10224 RepID=A0ABM0GYM7_SACKO|nr:PREDICTED: uncharacterized protein LOC100367746 [Saccoglossus kowalevskii]
MASTVTDNLNSSPKVILWIHARTRSTVFEMSVASVPTIKVFHEPFIGGHWFGEDRNYDFPVPPVPGYTRAEIRSMLEAEYPGYEAVFVKDCPASITSKSDYDKYLPRGYIHTFMIRDPMQSIPSYYKLLKADQDAGRFPYDVIEATMTMGGDLKPVYDLFQHVKDDLGQPPILIESNDLIDSPKEVMQKYCKLTGLPFRDSMLKWEPENISSWPEYLKPPAVMRYYQSAVNSSSFEKRKPPTTDDIPDELLKYIEQLRVYYYEMTKYKI